MVLLFDSFSGSPWVAFIYIYIYIFFFFSCFGRNTTKPKPESQFEFKAPQATQVRTVSLFALLALCISFQFSEALFTRYFIRYSQLT